MIMVEHNNNYAINCRHFENKMHLYKTTTVVTKNNYKPTIVTTMIIQLLHSVDIIISMQTS